MADPTVTVCIPAYQAEGFIERTLRCATSQTYESLRVLVSIDRSTDATEELCRAAARDDDRITVHVHQEQQRWFGNVNFLLDHVDSELAFIYFHDDVIEPTYCEALAGALAARPDAASAHCDVVLDGPGGESLRPGMAYDGTAAVRLLLHLVSPDRGALLRSVVRRSSPAGPLRMSIQGDAYARELVAAGPVVHVAEPLYRRFVERAGGLTVGFMRRPFDQLLEGLRMNVGTARALVEQLGPSPEERTLLEFGMAVYFTNRLRSLEEGHGADVVTPLEDVLGPGPSLDLPAAVGGLPEAVQERCRRGRQQALGRTKRRRERLAEGSA